MKACLLLRELLSLQISTEQYPIFFLYVFIIIIISSQPQNVSWDVIISPVYAPVTWAILHRCRVHQSHLLRYPYVVTYAKLTKHLWLSYMYLHYSTYSQHLSSNTNIIRDGGVQSKVTTQARLRSYGFYVYIGNWLLCRNNHH